MSASRREGAHTEGARLVCAWRPRRPDARRGRRPGARELRATSAPAWARASTVALPIPLRTAGDAGRPAPSARPQTQGPAGWAGGGSERSRARTLGYSTDGPKGSLMRPPGTRRSSNPAAAASESTPGAGTSGAIRRASPVSTLPRAHLDERLGAHLDHAPDQLAPADRGDHLTREPVAEALRGGHRDGVGVGDHGHPRRAQVDGVEDAAYSAAALRHQRRMEGTAHPERQDPAGTRLPGAGGEGRRRGDLAADHHLAGGVEIGHDHDPSRSPRRAGRRRPHRGRARRPSSPPHRRHEAAPRDGEAQRRLGLECAGRRRGRRAPRPNGRRPPPRRASPGSAAARASSVKHQGRLGHLGARGSAPRRRRTPGPRSHPSAAAAARRRRPTSVASSPAAIGGRLAALAREAEGTRSTVTG